MKKIFLLLLIPLFIGGCSSYKKSIYLRNDEVLEKAQQNNKQYVYRVMPKDELTITVSTSDPASSVPFYRKIGQGKDQASSAQGMNNAKLLDYLVDNEGNIDYPVLGKLHVAGLTTRECEALIRKELQQYLNEVPNVTVRTSNYKISVLGEVKSPGTYTVSDERINIFQALALAGDMTVFSVRDDVQLLREDSLGNRRVLHFVYVKPTKAKVHSNTFSNNSSTWVSLMSLAATIASLVIVAVQ